MMDVAGFRASPVGDAGRSKLDPDATIGRYLIRSKPISREC
jgi:hypothetical protein